MVKREFCERLVWWDRHPISFADRPCLPLRTQPGLLYLFESLLTVEHMTASAGEKGQEAEHEEAH